ncbi:AGAP002044-PA-like protein [Anopheles sinensis]|uniref:AGAP002044-PA-like protein n=1 Tax=Anopheles sinensis TaxID=74873 RepID=A0A084VG46_ANOSI|nr:AGAP002044-PA-like protein [Anopheles sinensis]
MVLNITQLFSRKERIRYIPPMEAPGQPSKICFLRWVEWMDMTNGINLFERSRYGYVSTGVFWVLQIMQLLIAYNFFVVCTVTSSLEEFSIQFNQFGGILLTFSRVLCIQYNRKNLQKTAAFINASKFHHLNESANKIYTKTLHVAKRLLSSLLAIQLLSMVFWFLQNEYQARQMDVLLPMVSYLPFDPTRWSSEAKFAFRLSFYVANTQLMMAFFGSYIITSCYLLTMTIELRILNGSYETAPTNPDQLVTFLRERVVYKQELLEHIGIIKRQMNLSTLVELVFIVCLLTINALRICMTSSNPSEVFMSTSMILIYVLELFQYCWQVDEIELLQERHAFAVYSTPWYHSAQKTKALLLITIRMSQMPLNFVCGGMYRLSTVLFASVIKLIYSLVMMLLQFK